MQRILFIIYFALFPGFGQCNISQFPREFFTGFRRINAETFRKMLNTTAIGMVYAMIQTENDCFPGTVVEIYHSLCYHLSQ